MPSQTMPKINLLKMPDPAAQTQKYVNMMNATKRQEAEERQADAAQKTLKLQQERGAREEALQPSALAKGKTEADVAKLDYVMNFYKATANDIANSSTPDEVVARAERLKLQFPDPALQARVDETVANLVNDPSRFEENRKKILIRTLDAKDQFAVSHSDIFDAEGNLYIKETSPTGSFPTRIMPGVVTGPANTGAAPAPVPRTPTAPQAATPNPFASGYKPNTAAAAPNSLSLVVDSALETGVMAKADFDKLVSIAQPGSGPKLEAWARQHNITIAPDAPGVTDNQMRGAPANLPSQMAVSPMAYDGRTPPLQFANLPAQPMQSQTAGLTGAPQMQNTMAQYQVGQQIKGKNPSMSPYPGSAQVPIERVRAEGVAGRASPAETAANEAAKIDVQTKAKIAEEDRLKAKGRKLFSSVLNDLRNDYQKLNRMEAIPSIERGGFENVGDYIGASRVGRMAQSAVGARASVPLNTISNSKLTLMNALKEATGLSATQLSSNIELMTFLDSLADPTQGFESAMETIRRLDNLYGAPAATATAAAAPRAAPKTPTIPDAAKQMLRKNPSPQQRAFFDRTFGKGAAAKVMGNR
jgi:hypothetical protein